MSDDLGSSDNSVGEIHRSVSQGLDDPNHPFYLHHSDGANTVVVSPPLTNSNYITWNRSFILAVSIKNKVGFLDGSIQKPAIGDPLFIPWERCNNILLSWILNSVSKEIASTIFYINSAREVWDKLKQRFAQPDGVRIYQLQQQLSNTVQGTLSVNDYFNLLNGIWEELRNYRPAPYCSCGKCSCNALNNVGETQQDDYAFKFLMGLNDSFDSIRGQIIMMSPLPSLDKAFSIVLQEERQRFTRNNASNDVNVNAFSVNFKKKDEILCEVCGKMGHLQEKCYRIVWFPSKDLLCEVCGKLGHVKEKCYRVVGFPANFQFTKGKSGPKTSTYDKGKSKI